MAIRTECIVNLKEVDFIMATCSKCKSEIRIEAGKQSLERCPICKERYTPSQQFALKQISDAVYELKNDDHSDSDIRLIKIEN
jgi:PHP family Zn ribbon phosphoesterase